MIRPGVQGGAGLAPAVGLIRSLSTLWGVTHHSLAVAVSLHSDRRHRTLRVEVGGSEVMLADQVDYVVGVDTHRDEHVLAVVVASTGAVVAQRSVPATSRGYARALAFADEHAAGRRVWAVEGAGHYGAGLARHLSGRGETALEAGRGSAQRAAAAGQGRPAGRGPGGPDGALQRDAGVATRGAATGGAAAADGRSPQCRRCSSGSARAAAQRDRDRSRRAPRRAARAACRGG